MNIPIKKTNTHIVRAAISLLIYFICCGTIFSHSPHKSVAAKSLKNISELDKTAPGSYVNLKIDKLYYTGLDSKGKKTTNGHYYYNITDNYCTIFLLSDASIQKLSKDSIPETITDYSFQGKIVEDENFNTKLRAQFSKQINWSNYELSKMTYPYFVSEINTEKEIPLKLTVILLALTALSLISAIINFIIYFKKSKTHPTQKIL